MPFEGINTYNENPLHVGLKDWYAGPGAEFEVPVDGYIIDLVQDGILVEIQTGNFGAMRRKIQRLIESHAVRLVHPIAAEKWIVRVDGKTGDVLGRRKSPKRRGIEEIFLELVTFPRLLQHPNFTLDVVLIHEEEVRRVGGPRKRRRRKDWVREERRLLEVVDHRLFLTPEDFGRMIPGSVPDSFTTADLSREAEVPRYLAQKMAYCMREMGVVTRIGRGRTGIVYERAAN